MSMMPDPTHRPLAAPRPPSAPAPARLALAAASLRPLRLLLALYLALWVFEGALRKWVLPGLANPLLVVRDPVLLLLYALAFARGVFPRNFMVVWITGLGAVALAVSFVSTNLPIAIQAYGFRADFLHLPLVFLIPNLIDRDGVRVAGKWFLIVAVPMGLLVTLQFLSSPGSFVNRGAGVDSTMIESAYGHIRPSGTFSFTNGLGGFTSIIVAFYLHHLLEGRVFPRLLWLAIGPVLVVMITLSGSRAAVGIVGLIMAAVIFICTVKVRYWGPALKLIAIVGLAIVALGSFAIFKDGLQVFAYRFGDSSNVRTGFFGRFVDSFLSPYSGLSDVPVGGVGLGMGTNVAAALLVGKRGFLVAEGEWPRVLMESGPIVGTFYLILRAAIVVYIAKAGLRSLYRDANTLPLLLLAGVFPEIIQGQFAQPTALGFATITGGLCLAACRVPVVAAADAAPAVPVSLPAARPGGLPYARPAEAVPGGPAKPKEAEAAAVERPPEGPPRRGRSIYAERLHGTGDNK